MNSHAKLVGGSFVGFACLMVGHAPAQTYDWQPPPNKITLLAVWAHPDDEGIWGGGSLPYYSTVLNVPTMLVCMTYGWGDPRENELRDAAWTYGLRYEPLFGQFADINSSVDPNNPYTNTIDMTWDYWAGVGFKGDGSNVEAGKARAINYVAEQIRRYRPDVIITHDVNGETGHDNHKATAYAVMRAFYVAADPNATATNLVGLPPWQAQKLYVHLYPTNQLFHEFWETPYPSLANQTARQVAATGLTRHVSQGPDRWIVASVYNPTYYRSVWPSEWWGLYASMVGPDTVLTNNTIVNGYNVPSGVAAGAFLEHLSVSELYFTTIPRSATVPAGSSCTLSASAMTTGSPLSYQWQFNGADIGDATAASLTLSNVQSANAGSYAVVVTNTAGALTSPVAVLTVLLPPMIISPPQTRTNRVGTAATFTARANGSGPLSYQWLLNGVMLQDDGNIQGATALTLQIANVQPLDAGTLVLAVSNTVGLAAATVGTLIVEQPPPCVPVSPGLVAWWPGEGDANDLAGTNNGALLGGATASAAGEVGQAFSFDGTNSFVQIPDSPQLDPTNLTVEAWVLFSALDSAGAGGSLPGQQYIVFKQNSLNDYHEGYNLTKTRTDGGDAFSFIVSSASGDVLALQSVTLVTTGVWYHVAGVRGSDFTQLYVNGQLESQTNVSFPQDYGTNDLFFGSSGQSDWDHKFAGTLDEVSLYNRALTASEIASIYAADASGKCQEAAVTAPPQSQTVLVGSNVTLTVTAVGPALSYQWFFNGTNALAGATDSMLSLTNLSLSQSGSYTVVVTNAAGALTSPAAVLTVLLPPVINAAPQTRTNRVGTAATFTASANGSGPLSYQWLLNGVRLQDDGNIQGVTAPTLQIANVQPPDAGTLVLVVSNAAGIATATIGTLIVEQPTPCVPVPPGLVAWWPGEGDANDLAGTNNGALLGGATASAAGKVAQAFSFDGTNSFVQFPDSPELNPTNLTIEAWVLFNALDSAGAGGSLPGQQYIVFKQNSLDGCFDGYSLTKTRTDGGDVFSFIVSSASGDVLSLQSVTLVTTGLWYHVAGVRGSDFTQLYVNGQLESQTNVSFPQDYGTNDLFFGSSGQSDWDHKFAGMLDEVSLYNRALAASEIASIYTADAGGKCQEATFTAPPQSQAVLVGSNVTFTVTALGPALSYQWFFNGTNSLAGATDSILSLTNLSLSQAGSYSVVASNFAGAVFSQPATLTVTPILGILMPINLSGDIGSSWRIDYVNDLGPTNNWLTLATVTLTNSSQVYVDTSALSQPNRFYRVVPLP